MITVITLRGTGETLGDQFNLLHNVTRALDNKKFLIGPDIAYPASIGPVNPQGNPTGLSEQQSINAAQPLIAEAVRDIPNLVLPIGYSLGASAVSRFLELQAQGQYADCELAGAAFVANPCRAPGEGIDPAPVGYGISGAHKPWPKGLRAFTAANPRDGITSCPDESPLRAIADGVDPLTFATLGWTTQYMQSLMSGIGQPEQWTVGQIFNAVSLIRGYTIDGQHNVAYIAQGYCQRLAQYLNAAL